jgi:hypothetical protein
MKIVQQRILEIAKYAVLVSIAMVAVTGVYTARGLYSDGPFWLYQILIKNGFYIFDMHRAYAQILVQLPVVVALELGVKDLNNLIRIHSFGFIVVPIAFWFAALLIQFRTYLFWLLVAGFSVTFLRSSFFAAGEFNTTYGLIALCVALMFKQNCRILTSLMLVLTAAILTHSYESLSFFGMVLAVVAMTRLFIQNSDPWHFRIALSLSCILFLYASYVAIRSMLYQRQYDLNATVNLNAFAEFHLNYLIAMCFMLFLVCCNISMLKKTSLVFVGLALSIIYAIYCKRWDATGISFGFFSYAYRSMGAFMLAGFVGLAWLVRYAPSTIKRELFRIDLQHFCVLVCALFAVSVIPLTANSYGFFEWLKIFEKEAVTVIGLVPVDQTNIARNQSSVQGYNWPWTNSTLSVLLRGNAEGIITNSTTFIGWETFDPKTVERYPLKGFVKQSYFYK